MRRFFGSLIQTQEAHPRLSPETLKCEDIRRLFVGRSHPAKGISEAAFLGTLVGMREELPLVKDRHLWKLHW